MSTRRKRPSKLPSIHDSSNTSPKIIKKTSRKSVTTVPHETVPTMLPYLAKIQAELYNKSSLDNLPQTVSSPLDQYALKTPNKDEVKYGYHKNDKRYNNKTIPQVTTEMSFSPSDKKKPRRGSGIKKDQKIQQEEEALDESLLSYKTEDSLLYSHNKTKNNNIGDVNGDVNGGGGGGGIKQENNRFNTSEKSNKSQSKSSPGELRYATVLIQKLARGFNARKSIWRLGGLGSIRAIIRIQCLFRQYAARSLLGLRLIARDQHAACLIQALYRGFQYGRLEAKRRRVEIMTLAASQVQRIYRGRLTKRWFAAFKAMIRESKTRFLQRCYRGSRARRAARLLRQRLEEGITNLGKVRMAYMSGAVHARVEALLGGGVCGRHPVVITKQVEVNGLESFEEDVDDSEIRYRHQNDQNLNHDDYYSSEEEAYADGGQRQGDSDNVNRMTSRRMSLNEFDFEEIIQDGTRSYRNDHGWMGLAGPAPLPTPNPSIHPSRGPTRSGTREKSRRTKSSDSGGGGRNNSRGNNEQGHNKARRSLYSSHGRVGSPSPSRPQTEQRSRIGTRGSSRGVHSRSGTRGGLESRSGMGTRNGRSAINETYGAHHNSSTKSSVSYGLILSDSAEEELLGLALGCACSVHDYGLSRNIIEALIRCAWAKICNDKYGGGVSCREAYKSAERAAEATKHIKSCRISAETSSRMRSETSTLYRIASLGPPIKLLYAYSIILQLDWASSGKYRILDHEALDEALLLTEKCWWAEGDIKRCKKECATDFGGSSFEKYEVYYFRAAAEIAYRKKRGPNSMIDAKSLRNMAVCYHTLYGEFKRTQPRKRGQVAAIGERRSWWSTLDAYRRAKVLFARALLLDEESSDPTLGESASTFSNIFATHWVPVAEVERTEQLPSRSLLTPATSKLLKDPHYEPPPLPQVFDQTIFAKSLTLSDNSSVSTLITSGSLTSGGPTSPSLMLLDSVSSSKQNGTTEGGGKSKNSSTKTKKSKKKRTSSTPTPGPMSSSRRGSPSGRASLSSSFSVNGDTLGPTARVKVIVYKCGRKCLLRASRIFVPSKFNAKEQGCPYGGWDKERDYPRYIHAPKEEGGGYTHVLTIGRWLDRVPPPPPPIVASKHHKKSSTQNDKKKKKKENKNKESPIKQQPSSSIVTNHKEESKEEDEEEKKEDKKPDPLSCFLEQHPNFYDFCNGVHGGQGKEDGRLMFKGMVIHEKEFINIEQNATSYFLNVQNRPETTVMAMDPFSRFSEFILPRLVLSSMSSPISISAPPPAPLRSRLRKIGDESKSDLYEAFNGGISINPTGLSVPSSSSSSSSSSASSSIPSTPLIPQQLFNKTIQLTDSPNINNIDENENDNNDYVKQLQQQQQQDKVDMNKSKDEEVSLEKNHSENASNSRQMPPQTPPPPPPPQPPSYYPSHPPKVFGDKRALAMKRKEMRQKLFMKYDTFEMNKYKKKDVNPSGENLNKNKNHEETEDEFDYQFGSMNQNHSDPTNVFFNQQNENNEKDQEGVHFTISTTYNDNFLDSSGLLSNISEKNEKNDVKMNDGEILFFNKDGTKKTPTNNKPNYKPKTTTTLVSASSPSFDVFDKGLSDSISLSEGGSIEEELYVEDVVVMTQKGIIPATKIRWLGLHVPALEWMRSSERKLRIKDQAAALLQRCYRGWERKAAWKRLKLRLKAQKRHEEYLQRRREEEEEDRAVERRAASFFQSRFKGWLWRVRLRKMQEVIVCIQVMVRGYLCRRKREAMERERLDGLPVHIVFERGMFVSGVPLLVTVKRCGLSYKFIGVDVQKCATYQGYVYGPQTLAILNLTQPAPPTEAEVKEHPELAYKDLNGWTKAVRPWQQEKVLELLLSMLALTECIGSVTKELRKVDPHKILVVHPELGNQVKGPTVLRVTGLNRTLKDQSKTSEQYQLMNLKEERKKANKQEPPKKSLQHQGKLVTASKVDTSRMSPAQRKAYERNKMVDMAAYRRLVRRVKPNLRLANLRFHRPPTPTPEERLAAKKLAMAEKKANSGKLGKEAIQRATKELDELFKDDN